MESQELGLLLCRLLGGAGEIDEAVFRIWFGVRNYREFLL